MSLKNETVGRDQFDQEHVVGQPGLVKRPGSASQGNRRRHVPDIRGMVRNGGHLPGDHNTAVYDRVRDGETIPGIDLIEDLV